jgi:spoIIIJ-associated protein
MKKGMIMANETNDLDGGWDSEEGDVEEGGEESASLSDADSEQGEPREKGRRKPAGVEPSDEQSRTALEFLTTLLQKMQMECEVHLLAPKEDAPSDIQLEISGRDSGRVIGKKGQVLSAVQFLCNRVLNRPGQERRYVTVDAEGYRSRREDSLASMARRLGKQAVTDGKIITFEPMNPRDRRIVHLALAKFEGVVTRSEGEGETRRVQIIPVRRQSPASA